MILFNFKLLLSLVANYENDSQLHNKVDLLLLLRQLGIDNRLLSKNEKSELFKRRYFVLIRDYLENLSRIQ